MGGDWQEISFGEAAEILPGKYLPATEYDRNGRFVIYGSNSIMGKSREPLYSGPLIAFARIGSNCGATMFSRDSCWINNNAAAIRSKPGMDTRFIYYWMQSFDFERIREGSGQPYISNRTLDAQCLLAPPLAEQRAIAHILGTLDDKIELNRRTSETLEAIARALFKSWFIDFDPVHAKAKGREPGVPRQIAELFPASFEDSDLGEIPAGWEVVRLQDLAAIQGGKQLPTQDCQRIGKFPVFGANGIMGYANRSTHDDFVVAFGRVGAYCGSVHWTYSGAWINNNASSVVPKRWPEYVLQTMLEADFGSMRTGSAQPFIPNSSLAMLTVARAPEQVMDEFCRMVRALRLREQASQRQSRTLAALRGTLLPKLLSGDLRVRDAEKFIERSV